MGIHSGKFGAVNGRSTVRRWTIAERATQPKAVASNSALGTMRKRGVHSWEGTYLAYGAQPSVMPGDTFSFAGYGSPTNDVAGAAGLRYEGDAVVRTVAIAWDWKSGGIIGHTVTFAGHLELIKQSSTDPNDTTVPEIPETTGTKFQYSLGNLNNFLDINNVSQGTLTLSANVASYVNSSTYINGKAWTGQKAGPIDWSLTITQEDEERLTGIFDIDDIIELKLFTNDTEFWQLKHAIVRDFSGITVDRETGAIIGRTINFDMNGYYGTTQGAIILPDTTTWWPF